MHSAARGTRVRSTLAFLALVAAACGDGSSDPTPDPVVAAIAVDAGAGPLVAGQTRQLAASATAAGGAAMTGATFAWSSGDPSVAAVSESGLVTAVGAASR